MLRIAVSQVARESTGWRSGVFLSAVLLVTCAHTARAAGVVGTGTQASCTEAAVDAALVGGGLVTFNCGASPVTITVTSQKTIAEDTSVDGGGLVTLDGGSQVRVLAVNAGATLTLANLAIRNGNSANAGGNGGAILNAGELTVTHSTFSGNSAVSGGAIYTDGLNSALTVTNSTFAGNTAASIGGAIRIAGGTLTVSSGTFSGNGAASGGAIYNYSSGLLDVTLTVTDSTFSGNSAANGGGAIFNDGRARVTDSTFSRNSANLISGGAIFNLSNLASTVTLTLTNSTFSDNVSITGGGGAIASASNNGALTVAVTNSTFSGNGAASGLGGGAIYNQSALGTLTVTLTNTIVANSTSGGNCGGGAVADGGHNLDDGTSCGFSPSHGSSSGTSPKLDPAGLANNGGPTQTIALQADSPAINAGDETVCAVPPVNNLDQRGYVRPGTGATACSIGAYEHNAIPASEICCQCPTSCAAPINNSCGDCTAVPGAACKDGALCVLSTPKPSPTATATVPSPTHTLNPTSTATIPSRIPTVTPTNAPGTNDCCQCPAFCAAAIVGTCGGCTVVFAASCNGEGLCVSRTPPTRTATASVTPTPSATLVATPTVTQTATASVTPTPTRTSTVSTSPIPTVTPTPTLSGSPPPTAKPCVGSCNGNQSVAIDDIITLVNIALDSADPSTCPDGNPGGGPVTIDVIVQAVNNALSGCSG